MVLPHFKENLEKYAKLLVANGINVQPGHTVALSIDVEQAELAHLLVKEAYALGAAEVIVQWSDDIINRERFLHADMDRIEEVPAYKKAEMEYLLAKKVSRLGVRYLLMLKLLEWPLNLCRWQLSLIRLVGL